MTLPDVVSRDEWLAARRELLVREKELTRARDRLNAGRRRLPMVRVDKPYAFDGPDGRVSLAEMVDRRPYPYLGLTALGRQEEWEEPRGRAEPLGRQVGGPGMRLPDEYS